MPTGDQTDLKISEEFASKLAGYEPSRRLRVVVLLAARTGGRRLDQRAKRAARKELAAAVRRSALGELPKIDRVLKRHGGRRLADRPNALGSVPVETTAAGVLELAALEPVKAVLEDQKVTLAR